MEIDLRWGSSVFRLPTRKTHQWGPLHSGPNAGGGDDCGHRVGDPAVVWERKTIARQAEQRGGIEFAGP